MKLDIKKTWAVIIGSLLFPVFTFATPIPGTDITDVKSFIEKVTATINSLFLPLLGAMSVMFLYSVFKFMTMGGDEKKRDDARKMMMWALVGFFAVVATYGIVALLEDFFLISSVGGDMPNASDLPGRP